MGAVTHPTAACGADMCPFPLRGGRTTMFWPGVRAQCLGRRLSHTHGGKAPLPYLQEVTLRNQ